MANITVTIDARFQGAEQEARRLHELAKNAGADAGSNFSTEFARTLNAKHSTVARSFNKSVEAVSRQTEAMDQLNEQLDRQKKLADEVVAAQNDVARVHKDVTSSLEERAFATDHLAKKEHELTRQSSQVVRAREQLARANKNVADSISNVLKSEDKLRIDGQQTLLSVGKNISAIRAILVPVGAMVTAGTLAKLAAVAGAASQGLLMIPAAATAAAGAFGTLKLATIGFGDALDDIGDPEKFAKALQSLSPNAQQAALAIQAIMPQLTALKNATQDAFFAGGSEMINKLSNQYLPTIQKFTTGVASAFNQAGRSLFNQLMTPETQSTIKNILADVESAFKRLAPAAGPFAQAIAKVVETGASFLPEIAEAARRAADRFAEFIKQASDSGDLKRWFSEGLETMGQLTEGVKSLGKAFINLAPAGREYLPDIISFLKEMETTFPKVINLVARLAGPLETWAKIIDGIAKGIEIISRAIPFAGTNPASENAKWIEDLMGGQPTVVPNSPGSGTYTPPAVSGSTGGSVSSNILENMISGGSNVTNAPLGVPGSAPAPSGPALPTAGVPSVPDGGYPVPAPPPDKGAAPAWTPPFFDPSLWQVGDSMIPVDALPGGMASPSGLQPNAANLNDIISAMFPMIPSAGGWRPPDGFNEHSSGEAVDFMTGGDFALGDAINAFILQNAEALGVQYTIWRQMMHYADGRTSLMEDRGSPTQNHMDHVHARVNAGPASAAGLAFPGAGAGGMAAGMMGGYVVDPEAVMRAEAARLTAKNDLEQKRLRLLELQAKGDATQRELLTAQNDVAEAERRFNIALLDEQQARRGKYKELDGQISSAANSIGQIGAALANDFGISEGLPGIAKWLTTFMANLAFAPAIGALSAVTAMSPIQGGYGMMGMMGANAMASGTYPGMGGMPMMPMMPGAAMMGPTPLGGGVGPGLMPGVTPPAVNGMLHGGLGGVPGVGNAAPVGGGGAGFGIPGVGPFGMAPRSIGGLGGPMLGGGMQIGAAGAGTALTSRSPTPGSGGGFQGFGGSGIGALAMQGIQTGLAGAGMAADLMGAGGAGSLAAQAAQTGIELANRTSGYIGQLAGIGVSGLLETFLPNNSQAADPSKSWFGRIASGLSGARPALPNTAGAAPAQQPKPQGDAQQQPGGPLIGAINNYTADSGQTIAKEIDRHRLQSNMAGAPRPK